MVATSGVSINSQFYENGLTTSRMWPLNGAAVQNFNFFFDVFNFGEFVPGLGESTNSEFYESDARFLFFQHGGPATFTSCV